MTTNETKGESPKLKIIIAVISAIALIIAAIIGSPYLYNWLTSGRRARSPVPVSQLEQQLSNANIILSEVDVVQVRTWLRTDPAYQALAQSCLTLLTNKRVTDPVPLDVINGRYKELLGCAPDKYLLPDKYNDLSKLKMQYSGLGRNVMGDIPKAHLTKLWKAFQRPLKFENYLL